jgi:hypothetical protein
LALSVQITQTNYTFIEMDSMPVYLTTVEGTLQSSCYEVTGGALGTKVATAGEEMVVSIVFRPSAACGQALPNSSLFHTTWVQQGGNHSLAPILDCVGDFSLADGSECRVALTESRATLFR